MLQVPQRNSLATRLVTKFAMEPSSSHIIGFQTSAYIRMEVNHNICIVPGDSLLFVR